MKKKVFCVFGLVFLKPPTPNLEEDLKEVLRSEAGIELIVEDETPTEKKRKQVVREERDCHERTQFPGYYSIKTHCAINASLKGTVHPKFNINPSFTHPAVLMPYALLSFSDHKLFAIHCHYTDERERDILLIISFCGPKKNGIRSAG